MQTQPRATSESFEPCSDKLAYLQRATLAPWDLEDHYSAAKERLLAAQQEKMEATIEFLALHTEMRRRLEMVWPGQDAPPKAEISLDA